MKANRLQRLSTAAAVVLLLCAVGLLNQPPPQARAAGQDFDAAAAYKAKCAMCHTARAEKFFDAAKADADLVQVVLKGRKGEKPPFMPAFEAKNITEAQAQALVAYMKSLKQ